MDSIVKDKNFELDDDKQNMEENQQKKPSPIDDRMKEYEAVAPKIISAKLPFLIRLDGHCFSKFTGNLDKKTSAFDDNFGKAMVLTMNDLITEFTAQTGYTHSDEITLIFAAAVKTPEDENVKIHIFNGRSQKIATLAAGYCSSRFNCHLANLVQKQPDRYSSKALELFSSSKAYFDARILVFPEGKDYEVINHMIWRSVKDCNRNAISTVARWYLGKKAVENKNGKEMKSMLLKEKGISWEKDIPIWIRHGVYAKKALKEIKAVDQKTLKEVTSVRGYLDNRSFKILFDEKVYVPLIFEKSWPESFKEFETFLL